MRPPSICIFLTTIGRPTLARTLESLAGEQFLAGDYVLLASDDKHAEVARVWRDAGLPGSHVAVTGGPHRWGHGIRNKLLPYVQSDYCSHGDDDDVYFPGFIKRFRRALIANPGAFHFYPYVHTRNRRIIGASRVPQQGCVGTPNFLHPVNIPLGVWADHYGGDGEFIVETLEKNRDRRLVWHREPHYIYKPYDDDSVKEAVAEAMTITLHNPCTPCAQTALRTARSLPALGGSYYYDYSMGESVPFADEEPEMRPPVEPTPIDNRPFDASLDLPVGLCIGAFKWPQLAATQIAVARAVCGPVPICVSCDDADRRIEFEQACSRFPDVFVWTNPFRIGHTGGDLSAFFKAIIWGKGRGLRYVAKLSQRFIPYGRRWLQESAAALQESDEATATSRCELPVPFPIRTEAVLMDLEQWYRPDILSELVPRSRWWDRPNGITAEEIVDELIGKYFGGSFRQWSEVMTTNRGERVPGVLWHASHSASEYDALAAAVGIRLEPTFHVRGWDRENKRGEYSYG